MRRAGLYQVQTERRVAKEKVGRNDPCPCGSGKKVKHCIDGPHAPSASRPSFDPRPFVQRDVVSFTPEHRLVQAAAVQVPGNLTFLWLGYAVATGQYFVYLKGDDGAYEIHEVPKAHIGAITRNWQEKITGFVLLLRVEDAETISDDAWRERAAAVLEDLHALDSFFRTSIEPARPYLYVRGVAAAAALADDAPMEVLAGDTAWMAEIPQREGTMRLTRDTTVDLPPDDALWVRQLDRLEVALHTTALRWRFFNGQCFGNVEQALCAPHRPTHITAWVGELIQPTGERAEHAWLVSDHPDGRSVIDLTLLHPDVMGALMRRAWQKGGNDTDHVLDLLIDRARRHEPLLTTRVVGRVPLHWMYEGTPMDAAAFIQTYQHPSRMAPAGVDSAHSPPDVDEVEKGA